MIWAFVSKDRQELMCKSTYFSRINAAYLSVHGRKKYAKEIHAGFSRLVALDNPNNLLEFPWNIVTGVCLWYGLKFEGRREGDTCIALPSRVRLLTLVHEGFVPRGSSTR
jgi:hypothetical protein